MGVSKAKIINNNRWDRINNDRVNVALPAGSKEVIREGAAASGLSVNAWIAQAIDKELKNQGFKGLPTRGEVRERILRERGEHKSINPATETAIEAIENADGCTFIAGDEQPLKNAENGKEEEISKIIEALKTKSDPKVHPEEDLKSISGEDLLRRRDEIIAERKSKDYEQRLYWWETATRHKYDEMLQNDEEFYAMADKLMESRGLPPMEREQRPTWEEYLEDHKKHDKNFPKP